MIQFRPNDFHRAEKPDYTLTWVDPDGREQNIGRIFYNPSGTSRGGPEWWWGVKFEQWTGRLPPYDGRAASLGEAKRLWWRCWNSAQIPVRW